MLADRLDKTWRARRRSTSIEPVMRFSDGGLVLGAGTLLAKSGGSSREISIDPSEPRLLALLAAAHLRRPTAGALAHLGKAAERRREGNDALADMHLALSQLDRLAQPEADAHRLFLADGLLSAGFDPHAIIDALEVGEPAFSRLGKYDPDQPRVPPGSGRTSGEWTSGSDASSSASSTTATTQSSTDQPEVNPESITPVVGSISACNEAEEDCLRAAEYASRSDAANDNARLIDISNCKEAGWGCDTLSWTVEDIPFLADKGQGGAVFFPHGGVVLVNKGQLDRYYPPLRGGKRPSFKRSLDLGAGPERGEDLSVGSYSWPPWNAGPDETIVSTPPVGFSSCRKVIGILATKMHGSVTDRTCSISDRWGKVIRAKVVYTREGSPEKTALVTCVSGAGPGIGIAMKMEGCCGK